MAKTKKNAFDEVPSIFSGVPGGIDTLFNENVAQQYSLISPDLINVKPQIRTEMEDEEHTLANLADSIKAKGLLQPILIRTVEKGYELVAGERRFRACQLAGLEQIPAIIKDMTAEEAEDAQLAENIHRKNLTLIEEAKKIQRDLNSLGSVDAVLEKHQKSRSWLSKILSLLDLPEQTNRLITENISSDLEVIQGLKAIEKVDPGKAEQLINDLKKTKGTGKAREKVQDVKNEVKPKKNKKQKKNESEGAPLIINDEAKNGDKPPQPTQGEGEINQGQDTSNADSKNETDNDPISILNTLYQKIFSENSDPKMLLDDFVVHQIEVLDEYLMQFYLSGQNTKTLRPILQGLQDGIFSGTGVESFALMAYIFGNKDSRDIGDLNLLSDILDNL